MTAQSISAMITAVVAILVMFITLFTWKTNRDRLLNELFDRRYAIFQMTEQFLSQIMITGFTQPGANAVFYNSVKHAYFVFGGSDLIKKFLWEINQNAAVLEKFQAEIASGVFSIDQKTAFYVEQEAKHALQLAQNTVQQIFAKYMTLGH